MEIVYSPHNRNYASSSLFLAIEAPQNLFCGERRNGGDLNSYNEFQCRKPISTRHRKQGTFCVNAGLSPLPFGSQGRTIPLCAQHAPLAAASAITPTNKKSALVSEYAFRNILRRKTDCAY